MIFDNADDPQLDVAKFFPVGNRGAILVTTRNPECRVLATVGSTKLDQMALDEAITLPLRSSFVPNLEDKTSQNSAKRIVEMLGCLALAIVHAGATIRQGACTLDDYCTEYFRHRKQLLDYPLVQGGNDYEHTVYSTWEVSIEKMTRLSNKAAKYAIDHLNFFSILHFEGISEKILQKAYENFQEGELSAWKETHIRPIFNQDCSEPWNSQLFREAIRLLASYSLIHIDGTEIHISLHPLVHTWIGDRLPSADQNRCYITSIATLSKSLEMTKKATDISYVVDVQKHIDCCLFLCQSELWVENCFSEDRIAMASKFGWAYRIHGRWEQARDILERTLEYSRKTMSEEHIESQCCMVYLGRTYYDLGETQKAIDLLEKSYDTAKNTLGREHLTTQHFLRLLALHLLSVDRVQETVEMIELELSRKKLSAIETLTWRSS